MIPAMSQQTNHKLSPLANEFIPHALRSTANLPALSTIMAQRKERMKQFPLFSHSLVGRAGLLREIGASYDHGAVTSAWAANLRHQYAFETRSILSDDNIYIHDVTSMVHDNYNRYTIAAVKLVISGRMMASMSYLPLIQSP